VGDCGGTLTGDPGADAFSLSGASLQAGARCVITLQVTMTVNGNLTNVISASSVSTLSGITNPDPAAATLTNLPGASVSKFFAPNPAAPGEPVQLTIAIQNTGGVALSGMGFVDVLPAGLEILDSPAPVDNCGGTLSAASGSQTIQLAEGALAASASCTVLVTVRAANEGRYTNTVAPGTLTNDQSATNHGAATDTLVITTTPGTTPGGQNPNPGQSGGQNQNNGQSGTQNQNTGQAGNPNTTSQTPVTGGSTIPATGFAPGRVTQLDTASAPQYDATTLTLAIPSLNVQAEILGVPEKDGGWDLSWLQDQVGWLNGTAFPTQRGNSLLTAHVVKADGQPGPFLNLKHLRIGEQVILSLGGYQYTYLVVSNILVQPDDSSVFGAEKESYITLITCDGYDEKTGTYLRRVAVHAKLIDISPAP
jgi:LPXTG-site transpeptidase (sortase) family protein